MTDNEKREAPHGGWPQTVENLGCALLLAVVLIAMIAGCVAAFTDGSLR